MYEWFREYLWDKVVFINNGKYKCNLFLYYIWLLLFGLPLKLDWLRKRYICIIWGCKIESYHWYNTPEDCYTDECIRCGAFEGHNMDTKYKLILKK